MGLDFKEIKEKIDKAEDKIPDDVKKKAKDLATKENLDKAKDKAEDLFKSGKEKIGGLFDKDGKKD